MLDAKVIAAVDKGLFHVYTAEHVSDGIELLTGFASGMGSATGAYPHDSVLGRAQKTLQTYRRACQLAQQVKKPRKLLR